MSTSQSSLLPPVRDGYERGYLGCTEPKCRRGYYYDYEPYSLSTPVFGMCHGQLVNITREDFDSRCASRSDEDRQPIASDTSHEP